MSDSIHYMTFKLLKNRIFDIRPSRLCYLYATLKSYMSVPFLILTRKSLHTHSCGRGCYNNQTNNDLYLSKSKYIVYY